MEAYLRALIDAAKSSLSGAISAVTRRLTSVWAVATSFFGLVHTAETRMQASVRGWIAAQLRHAAATLTTIRWIIGTYVPYRIMTAVTSIQTWTSRLINEAKAAASAELHAIEQWAIGEFNAVIANLAAIYRWAIAQVASLVNRAARLESAVFPLLSAPERLASWLVGAMVAALIRYALDHAEAIGRYVWARRQSVGLAAAHWIEDLIIKII